MATFDSEYQGTPKTWGSKGLCGIYSWEKYSNHNLLTKDWNSLRDTNFLGEKPKKDLKKLMNNPLSISICESYAINPQYIFWNSI